MSTYQDRIQLSEGGSPTTNNIKNTLADKLRTAADSIRRRSIRANEGPAAQFGNNTADWLEKSSDYVRDFEPEKLKRDLEGKVRENPGRTLLIAGAVGLILGTLIRRR
jgi:ElaB/YqjD/DUF883 family membrane-anchored ribosome-binding protein